MLLLPGSWGTLSNGGSSKLQNWYRALFAACTDKLFLPKKHQYVSSPLAGRKDNCRFCRPLAWRSAIPIEGGFLLSLKWSHGFEQIFVKKIVLESNALWSWATSFERDFLEKVNFGSGENCHVPNFIAPTVLLNYLFEFAFELRFFESEMFLDFSSDFRSSKFVDR